MIAIRKAWWATLLLTAFVGCGHEEPAGDNAGTTPPASSDAASAPEVTAPAEGKPAETPPPAEAASPSESMPKDAAPSNEGLKLDGPAVTPPAAAEKKEGGEASTGLTPAELTELASLAAPDKDLALKQVVCPVSGENLGSMGKPLKVSAEGKTFLICCKGCNDEVKDNPKEVIAKLKIEKN